MNKMYSLCLVGMLSFVNLMGSESAAASQNTPQKTTECTEAFVKTLGGENVSVSVENGQVKLSGPKDDVEKVIHSLVTPAELSQHFPLSTGVCPQPQAGQVKSWAEFMVRLAIPLKQFDLFKQAAVSQDDGKSIVFNRKGAFAKLVVDGFLQTITQESPFFSWMKSQFADFIVVGDDDVRINYALANKFVSYERPSVVSQMDDGVDNAEASFSHQWFLERLIIANSGHVVVRKEAGDNYRLMIAHQGVPINMPTQHDITICLDLSGSMEGRSLSELQINLPIFLRKLYAQLPDHMTLNIKIIGFDNEEFENYSLIFTREKECPSLGFISRLYARGGTNLNIIGQHVMSSANMCIGFTDGGHHGSELDIRTLSEARRKGRFAKSFLCPVGAGADASYFQNIASALGGGAVPQNSVQGFCNHVAEQANDLLTPQVAYSLMTQLAQAFWVPSANGLYDTNVQIKAGGVVAAASGHQTVLKPTVVAKTVAHKAPFKVTAVKTAVYVDPSSTNKRQVQKEGMTKVQKRAAAVKRAIAEQQSGLGSSRKKAGQRRI